MYPLVRTDCAPAQQAETQKQAADGAVSASQSAAHINSVNEQANLARAYALANGGNPPAGYFVIGDGPVRGPKQ